MRYFNSYLASLKITYLPEEQNSCILSLFYDISVELRTLIFKIKINTHNSAHALNLAPSRCERHCLPRLAVTSMTLTRPQSVAADLRHLGCGKAHVIAGEGNTQNAQSTGVCSVVSDNPINTGLFYFFALFLE